MLKILETRFEIKEFLVIKSIRKHLSRPPLCPIPKLDFSTLHVASYVSFGQLAFLAKFCPFHQRDIFWD